jgi:hypothetical protein
MHAVLSDVILAFRSAQDLAVSTLRDRLGILPPESNLDWATRCYGLGLGELGAGIGVMIRPHGYGVEMRFPAVSIDFDWGDRGEGYGFDVWRLWNHCMINRLFLDSLTYDLLKLRFERASADSELVNDRLLHYLPDERRRFTGLVSQP